MLDGSFDTPPPNTPAAQACQSRRGYASASEPDLKETLKGLIPAKRELLKKVKAVGDETLGECKVENALGGMRYGGQEDGQMKSADERTEASKP